MPDSPSVSQRGYLSFRNLPSGGFTHAGIASTGAATLSALLFGGSYDVTFTTSSANGLLGMPISTATSLAKGCLPAGACTASATEPQRHVDGHSRIEQLRELVAGPQGKRGRAQSSTSYSGTVVSGTRTGATFSLLGALPVFPCTMHG